MPPRLTIILALVAGQLCVTSARSAEQSHQEVTGSSLEDLLTMTQNDVLDMESDIASPQATTYRDAAGVLTVISRDEILGLGARDLTDVLHMVSGFALATDTQSVTSAGFRGIWGHEGKILLLVDGQEMNEPLYSTLQLGNHILLNNVDRIEIIRGPGSVIYGGNAELAVINVISRNARQIGHATVEGDYGQFITRTSSFADSYARRTVQAEVATCLEDLHLDLTGSVAWGQGNRSPGLYRDFNGSPPYRGVGQNAHIDPLLVNLAANWHDLHIRAIFDRYHLTDRYPYDTILDSPLTVDFTTFIVDVQYIARPTERLTITPRLTFKSQAPWHNADPTELAWNNDFYDKQVSRATAMLTATWRITDELSVLVGATGILDTASEHLPPPDFRSAQQDVFPNGKLSITYRDVAGFVQGVWSSPWINVTLGGRYEHHSAYGGSFVPRLAITKTVDRFHFKGLISQAFHAPAIENIHLDPSIRPERTLALEMELGYALTRAWHVGINLFDLTLQDPIVYNSDRNLDTYQNFSQTGSRGLEVEGLYRGVLGFAKLGYSFAAAAGKNRVPAYAVPQTSQALLGLPQHKLVLGAGLHLTDKLVLGPSLIILGPRYGTLHRAGVIEPTSFTWLANVVLTYHDLLMPGLEASLGLYNALDQDFRYIQSYNSFQQGLSNGHAPTPGLNREVMMRVRWAWQ